MNKQNTTCIQTVSLVFYLYSQTSEYRNGMSSIEAASELNFPEAINGLGVYLVKRLERISQMVQLLLVYDSCWNIATKKDKLIMQTNYIDFNEIQTLLSANGYNSDEYCLRVNYLRKWGVL